MSRIKAGWGLQTAIGPPTEPQSYDEAQLPKVNIRPDGAVFVTLVADPPWQYRDHVGPGQGFGANRIRGRRGAAGYYPTMPVEAIAALGAEGCVAGHQVAQDGHLYLWTTNAFMVEGHAVCRAWGFEPRTILTWVKPRFGMGWYFRNTTEHVIFAVRGTLRTLRRDIPTHFEGVAGRHSEKPAQFFHFVESQSPGPYLELFARRRRRGWTHWGNEVPLSADAVDPHAGDSSDRPRATEWSLLSTICGPQERSDG